MASQQKQTTNQQDVLYLLERPTEPFFFPKGDKKAVFDIPNNDYLVERFRPVADDLTTRFGEDSVKIPVRAVTVPDISLPMQLGRRENFSLFLPRHREMAARLIDIFLSKKFLSPQSSPWILTL
ncbi:hypothetical protein J437_LFUL018538 [Ladona fulva]|uniref:Uncharacterized protein n=1 Tax=Ladona fulva TaxID=123851 RepID=A0A8K0KRV2_LADFU|nr:hypothetical protein J437_LFUL018538 [Ladona fulva]